MKQNKTGLLFALLLIGVKLVGQTVKERPNIILLMGDDHGWEETGYNGHPFVKTPVLDQMARNGLQLNRLYASAPSSSPTRASILTGRNHNRCGTFQAGWSFRPEEITIAEVLKQSGYVNGHFGKWHVGPVASKSPVSPIKKGFDYSVGHDNFFDLNPTFSINGETPILFKGESSEILVNEASKFIENTIKEKKPFFVVIWFGAPHEPYQGLPKDIALYENLPDTFANREVTLTSIETGLNVRQKQRHALKVRYAEITAMDRAIGKLRDFLSGNDKKNNTLIWYCGDNGTSPDAAALVPFREQKGSVYDGGLRVPGIIEWPARITKHITCNINIVTTDIFPTICSLTGADLPKRILDGEDVSGVFDGTFKERSKPIIFWTPASLVKKGKEPYIEPRLQKGTTPTTKKDPNGNYTRNFLNFKYNAIDSADYSGPRSIIENRYKLVIDGRNGNKSMELFDLDTDPKEKNNIFSDHPEIASRLNNKMAIWQHSVLLSLTGKDYKVSKKLK